MSNMLLCGILPRDEALKPVDALLLALIGIAIVFILLILLMLVINLMGLIFDRSEKLKREHPEYGVKIQNTKDKLMFWKKKKAEDTPVEIQVEEQKELAEGSCGELKLINVEDKEAAMIMAIVADELKTPLNELRFKSIKRVDEEAQK